jgi:hypothetical protein
MRTTASFCPPEPLFCCLCHERIGFDDDDDIAIVFGIPQVTKGLDIAHQDCLPDVFLEINISLNIAEMKAQGRLPED